MGKLIYISRSSIVARKNCQRLRFLRYHAPMRRGARNLGYERKRAALPLLNGIQVHESLARLLFAGPESLEAIIADQRVKYREDVLRRGVQGFEPEELEDLISEQSALLEGLIRGWAIVRLPMLLEEYNVISIEEEFPYEIAPGIIDQVRLDGVLERKDDGALLVQEFKTVSYPGYSWANGWHRNTQMLANTLALEQKMNRRVEGIIIEGLVKGGRRRDDAASSPFFGQTLQYSPFTYGYSNGSEHSTRYTNRKGWRKVRSWETLPMQEWITEVMDPNELSEQFVPMPPIKPTPRHLERWKRQTIAEELEWQRKLDEFEALETDEEREQMLDVLFPQNEEHCWRYKGPCEMDDICWTESIEADPIGSELYVERQPHHPLEEEELV